MFWIQTSNPKSNGVFNGDAKKVADAIYSIFPLETEEAILAWNATRIPLSYRYDISTIVDDILLMVLTIKQDDFSDWAIFWPSNTFSAEWFFKAEGTDIIIKADWHSGVADVKKLNEANTIKMGKNEFLYEWKALLDVLISHLTKCGYSAANLEDMDALIEARDSISGYGRLYS